MYLFKVWSEYDGGEPLKMEMFWWLFMAIVAKSGSQGMCPILDSWNLDRLSWYALSMIYDDDELVCYKEYIGIMDW